MREGGVNDVYLPGFALPANVEVSSELAPVLDGAGTVLSVMPSHLVRPLYEQMLPALTPGMVFVSATKGWKTAHYYGCQRLLPRWSRGAFYHAWP